MAFSKVFFAQKNDQDLNLTEEGIPCQNALLLLGVLT